MSGIATSHGGVSIVVPAFDEELAIADTVRRLEEALSGADPHGAGAHEIIVVDDGSRDRTGAIAREAGAIVVTLPENKGYGAALKEGIARARHDTLAIIDADGTYPAEALPALIAALDGREMVVGSRAKAQEAFPLGRRCAKRLLRALASYVTNQPIPDLNSGLRVMRRDLVRRFQHLLPSGFSFTTTITMAALSTGVRVHFVPISYNPRIGQSKMRSHHVIDFLVLILRMAVRFKPLRVFLPLGALCFVLGAVGLATGLSGGGASWTGGLLLFGAGLLWAAGILADRVARTSLRREGAGWSA